MADCFISYRRTPSSPVATTIQAKLQSDHGFDVYVDTTRTDSSRVNFPERLMQAIEDAPVFVCLLGERDGEHTLQSEWVLKEIQRAYELKKFCVPVFQESYRPLPDMPPAVDYMLGFDGVHYFDQKNIMVDESVQQLADLIRPHRKRRGRMLLSGVAVLVILAVIIGVLIVAANSGFLGGVSLTATEELTPTTVSVVASDTSSPLPTVEETSTPTVGITSTNAPAPTFTDTPTPTITPPPSETLEIALIVGTLDAEATIEQATLNAQATLVARATSYAVGTQAVSDQTATASLWTDTPTPDITASIEAYRTQQAATETQAWINSWTDTPTATLTPTNTPTITPSHTATITPSNTPTDTVTPVPSETPTLSSEQIAQTPISSNAAWQSYITERNFDGVTMVLVPAGSFTMGSTEEGIDYALELCNETRGSCERAWFEDESPTSIQTFAEPFWIDKYEVTNARFGSTGCEQYSSEPDQPRNCVDWFDAQAFCEARGTRLPTEVEWEYAAQGPDSLIYPWGNEFVGDNVIYEDSPEYGNTNTAPVGSRPGGVSWVRALDMSGNIWEWTNSLYESYPYDATDGRERDTGDSTDVWRVLRGGSFGSASDYLRTAFRYGISPASENFYFGFRCARDYEP
ncbi:SUMF1/EgtB/PvdO family nonheme iron enzyme [Chloroflexota bacterium]